MHRIHVLHRVVDEAHDSWISPDGRVLLLREQGDATWKAVVDLVVVTDAERLNGGLALEGNAGNVGGSSGSGGPGGSGTEMRDTSVAALAERLARQERLHLVFDG